MHDVCALTCWSGLQGWAQPVAGARGCSSRPRAFCYRRGQWAVFQAWGSGEDSAWRDLRLRAAVSHLSLASPGAGWSSDLRLLGRLHRPGRLSTALRRVLRPPASSAVATRGTILGWSSYRTSDAAGRGAGRMAGQRRAGKWLLQG